MNAALQSDRAPLLYSQSRAIEDSGAIFSTSGGDVVTCENLMLQDGCAGDPEAATALRAALQGAIDLMAAEGGGTIWIHQNISLAVSDESPDNFALRLRDRVHLDFQGNRVTLLSNVSLILAKNCRFASVRSVYVIVFARGKGSTSVDSAVYQCKSDIDAGEGCITHYDEITQTCVGPEVWTADGGPCEGDTNFVDCVQTRPIVLLDADFNEKTSYNTFHNIHIPTVEHCVFYQQFYNAIQLRNTGGYIIGNSFEHIHIAGTHTGIHLRQEYIGAATACNVFRDIYVYQHVTAVHFDDVYWSIPITHFNLVEHLKGHTKPAMTQYFIRDVSGIANHLTQVFIWDFTKYNECPGFTDFRIGSLGAAQDTFVWTDLGNAICNKGLDTVVYGNHGTCVTSGEACDCECTTMESEIPTWDCAG